MTTIRRRCVALVAAVVTTAGVMTAGSAAPASAAPAKPAAPAESLALAKSLMLATSLTLAKPAVPAEPMATAYPVVCLTNSDTYCLGPIEIGVISGVIGAFIYDLANRIAVVIIRTVTPNDEDPGDEQDELQENGTDLCLADTGLSPFVDAKFTACGANGTVWIVVPHSDGDYLYSRYSVDNGDPMVLTTEPGNGNALYVYYPENSGSAYWQTWSYYPYNTQPVG